MNIINLAGICEKLVDSVTQRSGVAGESFVLFLDEKPNTTRAETARSKLAEYGQKPLPAWEQYATGDTDFHACTEYPAVSSAARNSPTM